jgi:hypothetical protein
MTSKCMEYEPIQALFQSFVPLFGSWDPDPHQSDKQDPDPHPDPHQSDADPQHGTHFVTQNSVGVQDGLKEPDTRHRFNTYPYSNPFRCRY